MKMSIFTFFYQLNGGCVFLSLPFCIFGQNLSVSTVSLKLSRMGFTFVYSNELMHSKQVNYTSDDFVCFVWSVLAHQLNRKAWCLHALTGNSKLCILYSISQDLCTRFAFCCVLFILSSISLLLNSLWQSDAIRRQGTEWILAQVMACCLTAPSHYLNQCWLIISKVTWHSSEGIIMRTFEDTNQ